MPKGGRLREKEKRNADDPASGEEALIRMTHVTKIFDADEGVRDVSLEIRKGEILALVGESGERQDDRVARILTGMLREDAGQLYYRGRIPQRGRWMDSFGGKVQMVFRIPMHR